jgi:hypothetical protein
LAKITQHIDLRAFGETEGTKWLSRYTSGGFEIEHIFPQQPSNEAAGEFGAFEDQSVADRLGNLVLVEKSINVALGNRPYPQKRDVYPQSQLLLTKALAERPKNGTNTRIDVAVADIEPFKEWNEAAVIKRQDLLMTLARSMWSLTKNTIWIPRAPASVCCRRIHSVHAWSPHGYTDRTLVIGYLLYRRSPVTCASHQGSLSRMHPAREA